MRLPIIRLESPIPSSLGNSQPRQFRASTLAVTALALMLAHCSSAPPLPPVHPPLQQVAERNLVVFVPGVLGTKLRHRRSGRFIWGKGWNVLLPHDGGYAAALPITHRDAEPDEVESVEVVDEVNLAGIRRIVYRSIVDLLETNGYRKGELEDPHPGEDLFLFAYDWRRSNVVSARLLFEQLEKLREKRGLDVLKVDLICQSNGAYVCRWLAKYGPSGLEAAAEGRAGPPAHIDIGRLVLVGASNGGSLRTLRELDRGRTYVGWLGRTWQPETLFTFRTLYQDLPIYARDLFLDENGMPLEVDIFDPETWRRYGWSIYHPRTRARMRRARRPDLFADQEQRDQFLARMLREGRQFQELLHEDVEDFPDIRYYLVLNLYEPTARRAVLVEKEGIEKEGSWRTWFTHDKELVKRSYIHALGSAPGDGHATWESQLHLSSQELAAVAAEPFQIWGDHFAVILDPATHRRLLHLLHDEGEDRPDHGFFHVPVPSSEAPNDAVPNDELKSKNR